MVGKSRRGRHMVVTVDTGRTSFPVISTEDPRAWRLQANNEEETVQATLAEAQQLVRTQIDYAPSSSTHHLPSHNDKIKAERNCNH